MRVDFDQLRRGAADNDAQPDSLPHSPLHASKGYPRAMAGIVKLPSMSLCLHRRSSKEPRDGQIR